MEKYFDELGVTCYRGVNNDTPFKQLEFHEVFGEPGTNKQFALHTNMGTLTVLDRVTGFCGGIRDTETGFRAPNGGFWLATGMCDVRNSGAKTMKEAIDFVKSNATMFAGAV